MLVLAVTPYLLTLYSAQLILRSVDSLSAKPYQAGRRISVQGCGRAEATARESSGVGSKPAVWRTGLVQHQLTCVLPSQLTCVLPRPAEVELTRPSGVHGIKSRGTVGCVLSMMMVSTSLSDESPGA